MIAADGEAHRHAHRGDHARRALAQLDDRQHRETAAATHRARYPTRVGVCRPPPPLRPSFARPRSACRSCRRPSGPCRRSSRACAAGRRAGDRRARAPRRCGRISVSTNVRTASRTIISSSDHSNIVYSPRRVAAVIVGGNRPLRASDTQPSKTGSARRNEAAHAHGVPFLHTHTVIGMAGALAAALAGCSGTDSKSSSSVDPVPVARQRARIAPKSGESADTGSTSKPAVNRGGEATRRRPGISSTAQVDAQLREHRPHRARHGHRGRREGYVFSESASLAVTGAHANIVFKVVPERFTGVVDASAGRQALAHRRIGSQDVTGQVVTSTPWAAAGRPVRAAAPTPRQRASPTSSASSNSDTARGGQVDSLSGVLAAGPGRHGRPSPSKSRPSRSRRPRSPRPRSPASPRLRAGRTAQHAHSGWSRARAPLFPIVLLGMAHQVRPTRRTAASTGTSYAQCVKVAATRGPPDPYPAVRVSVATSTAPTHFVGTTDGPGKASGDGDGGKPLFVARTLPIDAARRRGAAATSSRHTGSSASWRRRARLGRDRRFFRPLSSVTDHPAWTSISSDPSAIATSRAVVELSAAAVDTCSLTLNPEPPLAPWWSCGLPALLDLVQAALGRRGTALARHPQRRLHQGFLVVHRTDVLLPWSRNTAGARCWRTRRFQPPPDQRAG